MKEYLCFFFSYIKKQTNKLQKRGECFPLTIWIEEGAVMNVGLRRGGRRRNSYWERRENE